MDRGKKITAPDYGELLDDNQLAELLNVTPARIRQWRSNDRNLPPEQQRVPRYIKLGKLVRTPMTEAQAFIKRRMVGA